MADAIKAKANISSNNVWRIINENNIKSNPDYSIYNFRNKKLIKIVGFIGNDLETSVLLFSVSFCIIDKNAFCIANIRFIFGLRLSPDKKNRLLTMKFFNAHSDKFL